MKSYSSKTLKLAIYLLILLFGIGLVFFSREISQSAAAGLKLCATTVIPGLFPFFVISSLAVSTNMAFYIGRALEKPMRRVFNLPGACASALALGLIGGYPLGAKTCVLIYNSGGCTKSEAERALAFCCNCGPAFIFGVAGASVFGSIYIGGALYVVHILAALLVGMVFGTARKNRCTLAIISRPCISEIKLGQALTQAIAQSASSMLSVCAFVVFFGVAIKLLSLVSPFPAQISQILLGMLEMTNGVCAIAEIQIPQVAKMALASFLIAFGGICVYFQTLSFTSDAGLSTKKYIVGKLLHGVFAATLTIIFYEIVNFIL